MVSHGAGVSVDYEEIEEGIHPTATYSSFSRRIPSAKWGIEETRRFYEVHVIVWLDHMISLYLQLNINTYLLMSFMIGFASMRN